MENFIYCLICLSPIMYQFSSVAQSCPTLCDSMNQHTRPPFPSPTPGVHSKFVSIESVMPSSHLILLSLLFLPLIPPSIRVFSNESTLHMRWPKYWSFCFNISPTNEHPGLVSFRMVWLDLFAVQGTLKSLLQYHSSQASILWHSAFLTVQLSHLYMTTGKTIALTRQTFVSKVMSLLFNMLSRLVITFANLSCIAPNEWSLLWEIIDFLIFSYFWKIQLLFIDANCFYHIFFQFIFLPSVGIISICKCFAFLLRL